VKSAVWFSRSPGDFFWVKFFDVGAPVKFAWTSCIRAINPEVTIYSEVILESDVKHLDLKDIGDI